MLAPTRRVLLAAGTTLFLVFAAAADAQATTRYAVPGGLGPAPCGAADPCSLTNALAAAATDDTVQLGEGTYAMGPSALALTKRVTVVGDPAVAAPSITSSAAAAVNSSAAGVTLKHLRVSNTVFANTGISAGAALNLVDVGIGVGSGVCLSASGTLKIQDTTMTQAIAGNASCLVTSSQATLLRTTVTATKASVGTTTVILNGPDSVVDQSAISTTGAGLTMPGGTIRRTRITAVTAGAIMRGTVTDSLFQATGTNGIALILGQGLTTVVRGVTAIATGGNSVGIKATAATFGGDKGAQLDGKNLIARGTHLDIQGEDGSLCQPTPPCANGLATVTFSNASKFSATTVTPGAGMQSGDPQFVSASDFRLRTGSPAIDAGTADVKNGTRDLNGLLRPQNGKFDMGAYEYPKLQFPLNPGTIPPVVDPEPDPGPVDPGNPVDPAPPGNGGPGADTTAPALTSFSLQRTRFRAAGKRTATTARRAGAGTSVRFTLSEPATVRVAVQRRATGRRSGTACVKSTKTPPKAKRCTRFVTVVTLVRAATTAGQRKIAYSGRTKGRTLRSGRYRFSVTATDATGNVSKARTASFRVVRR